MSLMQWSREGSVATLTMTNGANKQNLDFARAFNSALDEILADEQVSALVVASNDEKNWSQGIQVEWLMAKWGAGDTQAIKDFLYGMNEVFSRLCLLPIPAIAAINGHAFGNGALLACCCDFRFMRADKGFFCLPEVDVSIPFLPSMLASAHKALPAPLFNYMSLTGARITGPELLEYRAVESCHEGTGAVLAAAQEFAKGFNKKRGIFGEIKKRRHGHIKEIMEKEDPKFIEPLNLMVTD